MAKMSVFGFPIGQGPSLYGPSPVKKRAKLTPSQRLYIWEHPKLYGRKCHICGTRITKMSDLELDHKRAFSKGGAKLFLAHKECNRMKGNKSLGYVQTRMGFKKTKAIKRKRTRTRSQPYNPLGIRPIKIGRLF